MTLRLRSIVGIVACAAMAACGGGATTAPSTTTNGGLAFPASASGTVHIFNWTDYLDSAELKGFTAETGIQVELDVYDSNETLLAKLQSGNTGYDVIFPSDYMARQLRDLGLLQRIDLPHFPNYSRIKPEFRSVPWDPDRSYTAPYMYGTTGIVCNPVGSDCGKVKSWHDYFTTTDPKVSSIKDQVEVVSAALRAVGVSAADLCKPDPVAFQRASTLLAGFHPITIDSDSSTERLLNGDTTLEQTWNGEAHRIRTRYPDAVYIYPAEGVNRWADNMAIPVGAQNTDAAMVFLNWMMDPKHIAAESNYTGYDNSIVGAADFMDSSLRTDPAVVPPADVVSRFSPTPDCGQAARDMYTDVFTTWLTQ